MPIREPRTDMHAEDEQHIQASILSFLGFFPLLSLGVRALVHMFTHAFS